MTTDNKYEEYHINGKELLAKIEQIIKEGNARRIIIKNDKDQTVVEFPVTVGAIGLVLAPMLAAVAALAALLTNCTILVEKRD